MRLSVNVDHVATIREARKTTYPSPVEAAIVAQEAGATGITVHLRLDRRHIKEDDIEELKKVAKKLNVEISTNEEMIKLIAALKPDQVTLVPEREGEITTEGGFNLKATLSDIQRAVNILVDSEIETSIFVDPNIDEIKYINQIEGLSICEINTDLFAKRYPDSEGEIAKITDFAKALKDLGLKVFAGHALTYWNLDPITKIEEIEELNIGHGIIARAIIVGMREAVKEILSKLP